VPQDANQEAAFKAVDDELKGEVKDARRKWQELGKVNEGQPWGLTAVKHADTLDRVENQENTWKDLLDQMRVSETQTPDQSSAERKAFRAYRAEHFGEFSLERTEDGAADRVTAKKLYTEAKEEAAKDPDQQYWMIFAAYKENELGSIKEEKNADELRKQAVTHEVEIAAKYSKGQKIRAARLMAQDVIEVYGKGFPELEPLVEKARTIVEEINTLLKK
jgi:hypothetical protein